MRKVAVAFVTALLGLGFFGCSAKGDSHGAGSGGAMPGTGGATGQVGSGGATAGGGGASSQTGGGAGGQGTGGATASGGVSAVGGSAVGGRTGTGGATGSGGTSADAAISTGGQTSTGGASGTGGVSADAAIATGGRTGTGGATGSGGTSADAAVSTGGRTGTGGATGSGGVSADAGVATGGRTGTGGATGSGGTLADAGASTGGRTGGATGTGGAGSGGATSTGATTGQSPYKGVANSPAAQLAALGATWCYNWGTSPKASDCNDPLFVPMVWGGGDVAGAIKAIGDAGYKTVLGFNEPNKTDQSNMTVDAAIALWPTLTSNPNIRVSSPAVSDDGRAWLESFMTQVKAKGLRVDFIAMHWYGWNAGSCTSGQLEGAINWASKWGLPVWITEFGCMGSSNPDEQTLITFFNNSIAMLKNHPLVERYAWYPWNTYNDLYRANASGVSVITSLGTAFVAAPQYR
jgi:hypothetical protein